MIQGDDTSRNGNYSDRIGCYVALRHIASDANGISAVPLDCAHRELHKKRSDAFESSTPGREYSFVLSTELVIN